MRLTVRAQILIVSLAAILPLMAGQVYMLWERFTFVRDQAIRETRENAQVLAAAASAALKDLREEVSRAAAEAAPVAPDSTHLQPVLRRIFAAIPTAALAAFVVPEGGVAVSTPRPPRTSLAALPAVQKVNAGAAWEPIDLLPGALEGNGLAWGMAVGVRQHGRLLGSIVVLIPAQAFERFIPVRLPPGSWTVTDRGGRIVHSVGDPALTWEQRDRSAQPLILRALAGEANTVEEFVGPRGTRRLGAAAPVSPFGWALVASRPVDEILEPARRQERIEVVIALAGMALALLLSLPMGQRISRPLARLVRGTHRIAHGRNDVLTVPEGPAEVAELTASFNLMAQRLHARQKWDTALKTIGSLAASRRPLRDVLDGGLEAIMEASGATLGIVRLADPSGARLTVAAQRNTPSSYLERHNVLAGEQVPAGGMVIPSLSEHPAASHWRDLAGPVESLAYLPLADHGQLVGTLTLGHPAQGHFQPDGLDDLRPAASFLAGAILAEQLRAAAEREASEKGLLLRELDHRVRNNLAALIGLLNLGEDQLEGPAAQRFREMADRVQRLAEVHDLLAGRWHQSIAIREVAELVAKNVLEALPATNGVQWSVTGNGTRIPPRQVTPLAMVLNELLTNIVKHAFAGRPGGRVDIGVASQGGTVEVRVADDGVGRPASPPRGGLGTTIVNLLVERSLGGTVAFGSGQGTQVTIRFPKPEAPEDPT